MLKDTLLSWADEVARKEGIKFQQDGATSYTAKMVQELCKANF